MDITLEALYTTFEEFQQAMASEHRPLDDIAPLVFEEFVSNRGERQLGLAYARLGDDTMSYRFFMACVYITAWTRGDRPSIRSVTNQQALYATATVTYWLLSTERGSMEGTRQQVADRFVGMVAKVNQTTAQLDRILNTPLG